MLSCILACLNAYKAKSDAGFWQAHDALFESAPKLEDDDLKGIASIQLRKLEKLLADKAKLSSILKHHVARGRKLAEEVVQYDTAGTLEGSKLTIVASKGEVRIGGARVLQSDVLASNGVIHVIDRVLLPTAPRTIVDVARAAGRFETLLEALEATGLDEALGGEGPFTVFAPTDDAFAALPEGALDALLADPAKLARVLKYHVVPGRVLAAEVVKLGSVKTLEGTSVPIEVGEKVRIGDARILETDLVASNGVIHVIDAVLLPRDAPVRFPTIRAKNLEREKFELPGDFEGERNLCLVAFQRWQQEEVDTWLEWLEGSSLEDAPGFAYYELPTLNKSSKLFERFLDEGMRSGIPSRKARERTITLWTDKKAFKRALEIPNERTIQVLLVDREGNVLWRTAGRFTEEKGKSLRHAVESRAVENR